MVSYPQHTGTPPELSAFDRSTVLVSRHTIRWVLWPPEQKNQWLQGDTRTTDPCYSQANLPLESTRGTTYDTLDVAELTCGN